ncbi:hypothetical protein IFR05_008154 [Cadophora sp. M221]|nr:hypothetical protein IFR05_008154 [Cadophora sp. M221]
MTKNANKEKRKAQFLTAQASLPEEERLGHEDRDWEEHVFRQWSLGHEAAILVTKEGFLDFLTDADYSIGLTAEEATRYFQKNGKSPTTGVLRRWLECEAYRRPGKTKGAKLHYNTLHAHVDKLCLLFKRAQNPMNELLSREIHEWIDASLVPRGLLSTATPLKQVAMPADLTLLRETLFQIEYLSTFADCRSPLQLALFLSLVVDCSGRAWELIAPSNKKTDNNKHLKWSQISFFAFPTSGGVTVRANVTFGGLKDKTFNPSKYKITQNAACPRTHGRCP